MRVDALESVGWIGAAGSLFSTLITLAIDVALLAVALGPVRRHRPDVGGVLATAAVVLLLTSLCSPALSMGVSVVMARAEGPASVVMAQAAIGLFLSLLRAAGFAMIVAGIARLASPARHDPREPL